MNRAGSDRGNGVEPEKNASVVFRAEVEIEHRVTRDRVHVAMDALHRVRMQLCTGAAGLHDAANDVTAHLDDMGDLKAHARAPFGRADLFALSQAREFSSDVPKQRFGTRHPHVRMGEPDLR